MEARIIPQIGVCLSRCNGDGVPRHVSEQLHILLNSMKWIKLWE